MAGGFLAVSASASALTSNQVIAFVLAATLCFLMMVSGFEIVQSAFAGWAPTWVITAVSQLSMLRNFEAISRGVIDLRDVVYFLSLIGTGLAVNIAIIEYRKTG